MHKLKVIAITMVLVTLYLVGIASVPSAPPAFPPVRPPSTHMQVTLPPSWYSGNQAPVGVTDYGAYYSGSVETPYKYSTSEFMGNFTIYTASFTSNSRYYPNSFSIQLNVVLNYTKTNGQSAYLWVQDVAVINAATNQMNIVDNIWNLTSSKSVLKGVSGNGKIYTYQGQNYYAYQYPSTISFAYPLQVSLFVTVSVNSQRYPVINFYFIYGGKVVQYDSVVVKVPVQSAAFYVEGYTTLPSGLYEDAELVTGGPGGGSNASPSAYKAYYTLQFLNGTKLVSVPHAFDYGADTAETVTGMADTAVGSYTAYLYPGSESWSALW